jgi:hypothetical protein
MILLVWPLTANFPIVRIEGNPDVLSKRQYVKVWWNRIVTSTFYAWCRKPSLEKKCSNKASRKNEQ